MLWGEHLHATEQPSRAACQACPAIATVEVLGADGRSHGIFCLRCGRRKLRAVQHVEDLFAGKIGHS